MKKGIDLQKFDPTSKSMTFFTAVRSKKREEKTSNVWELTIRKAMDSTMENCTVIDGLPIKMINNVVIFNS